MIYIITNNFELVENIIPQMQLVSFRKCYKNVDFIKASDVIRILCTVFHILYDTHATPFVVKPKYIQFVILRREYNLLVLINKGNTH